MVTYVLEANLSSALALQRLPIGVILSEAYRGVSWATYMKMSSEIIDYVYFLISLNIKSTSMMWGLLYTIRSSPQVYIHRGCSGDNSFPAPAHVSLPVAQEFVGSICVWRIVCQS